jgi:hypothetical protein
MAVTFGLSGAGFRLLFGVPVARELDFRRAAGDYVSRLVAVFVALAIPLGDARQKPVHFPNDVCGEASVGAGNFDGRPKVGGRVDCSFAWKAASA